MQVRASAELMKLEYNAFGCVQSAALHAPYQQVSGSHGGLPEAARGVWRVCGDMAYSEQSARFPGLLYRDLHAAAAVLASMHARDHCSLIKPFQQQAIRTSLFGLRLAGQ